MFQLLFEEELLKFQQNKPSFAPLLKLPPTWATLKKVATPWLETHQIPISRVYYFLIIILTMLDLTYFNWGLVAPKTPTLLVFKKAGPDVPKATRRGIVEVPAEQTTFRTTVEATTNKGDPIAIIFAIAIITISVI